MIAQGIEDALSTGMRKVHILISKNTAILTWAEVEPCYRPKLIINGQDPENGWYPPNCYMYAISINACVSRLITIRMNLDQLFSRQVGPIDAIFLRRLQLIQVAKSGKAIIKTPSHRTSRDHQASTLDLQHIFAQVKKEVLHALLRLLKIG